MAVFRGSYEYALDDKGRVNIPAKFRKALSPKAKKTYVLTRGLEGCIFVYPLDVWERMEEQLKVLPATKEGRYFLRMFISHAHEVSEDGQGRILLPQTLLEFAGIDKKVLIIGALERMEIWNPDLFQGYLEKFEKTYEQIAEEMAKITSF